MYFYKLSSYIIVFFSEIKLESRVFIIKIYGIFFTDKTSFPDLLKYASYFRIFEISCERKKISSLEKSFLKTRDRFKIA